MVGDKVHNDPRDPTYSKRMQAALGEAPAAPDSSPDSSPGAGGTPGVIWHGGQSRAEAMRLAAAGDVGLSWRHPELDASLELSTKVLEFGQLGLPVILNRTPMHEALLGADYPLFAASLEDVADAAAAACDQRVFALAASRTSAAAASFALDAAADRLRAYLARAVPGAGGSGFAGSPGPERLRVVIAGHDLKFFTQLLGYFRLQPDLEIRVDHWAALGEHDESLSRELAEWADVVVCEWCGPNAVWYSRHKRRSARLLVRLHRFELYAPYPAQVKIGNVDTVICVSDYYARLTREKTGWPAAKIVTVPNALDVLQFDRPKLDGARFHLGMIGIVPAEHKRFDLALDVLEELRRDDDRYQLFVKSGSMPWELWWVWKHAKQRQYYSDAFRRVQRSPLLQGAVVFDDAGPDVPAWLRRVGFILSTSDDESFHMAPAEGMASRAVPAIRHWPGAETIYDARWIGENPAEMTASIAALSSPEAWEAARQAAHQDVLAWDLGTVAETWLRYIRGAAPAGDGTGPEYQLQGSAG
jgi:glycosyltransferase involved in cell wall biosynthesis